MVDLTKIEGIEKSCAKCGRESHILDDLNWCPSCVNDMYFMDDMSWEFSSEEE